MEGKRVSTKIVSATHYPKGVRMDKLNVCRSAG